MTSQAQNLSSVPMSPSLSRLATTTRWCFSPDVRLYFKWIHRLVIWQTTATEKTQEGVVIDWSIDSFTHSWLFYVTETASTIVVYFSSPLYNCLRCQCILFVFIWLMCCQICNSLRRFIYLVTFQSLKGIILHIMISSWHPGLWCQERSEYSSHFNCTFYHFHMGQHVG